MCHCNDGFGEETGAAERVAVEDDAAGGRDVGLKAAGEVVEDEVAIGAAHPKYVGGL